MQCSINALVTAINTANSGGPGTLLLAGNCTYGITIPATAPDGLPLITGHIGLVGGPNTVIRRSPAALTAFRVLDVAAGASLRVSNLSIRNGKTAGLGGGIQNAGSLWVSKVTFSGNNAGNGGALSNNSGATATLYNATIAENTTTGVGGGGIINALEAGYPTSAPRRSTERRYGSTGARPAGESRRPTPTSRCRSRPSPTTRQTTAAHSVPSRAAPADRPGPANRPGFPPAAVIREGGRR